MSQAPAIAAVGAPAEPAPKGGTSKVVLVLVLLNLVAVAGVGGYVALQLRQRPAAAAGATGSEQEGGAAAGHRARARGPIIALDSLVTNVVDADAAHFLKVTVQLEAKDEAAAAEVEAAVVPIRDRILLRLSSLTLVETQGAEKKRAIQGELIAMINSELGAQRVTHVYFTEFVVQ